jgi:competence protein ComEA
MPINKKKYIIYLFLCVWAGSLLYFLKDNRNLRDFLSFQRQINAEPEIAVRRIKVLVRGAVKEPGLYSFPAPGRLKDLIEKSQGLLRYADQDRIEWDRPLVDGSEYDIPYRKLRDGEKIDINQAGLDDLCMLPGMTRSLAREIIRYRIAYERFDELDEVKEVEGVGEKRFSRMKKFITVGE